MHKSQDPIFVIEVFEHGNMGIDCFSWDWLLQKTHKKLYWNLQKNHFLLGFLAISCFLWIQIAKKFHHSRIKSLLPCCDTVVIPTFSSSNQVREPCCSEQNRFQSFIMPLLYLFNRQKHSQWTTNSIQLAAMSQDFFILLQMLVSSICPSCVDFLPLLSSVFKYVVHLVFSHVVNLCWFLLCRP